MIQIGTSYFLFKSDITGTYSKGMLWTMPSNQEMTPDTISDFEFRGVKDFKFFKALEVFFVLDDNRVFVKKHLFGLKCNQFAPKEDAEKILEQLKIFTKTSLYSPHITKEHRIRNEQQKQNSKIKVKIYIDIMKRHKFCINDRLITNSYSRKSSAKRAATRFLETLGVNKKNIYFVN